MEPDEHRAQSLETWEKAAAGWSRRATEFGAFTEPVSRWLIDALHLQPGHRVLDLAAGTGEVGLLAAELVAPGGTVIIGDQAQAMLTAAERRAKERGLQNLEFKVIDAEWIDLSLAEVDGVVCRWGYMLMADPAAALRETRRVLRAGGRLSLAVWDRADRNPWTSIVGRELVARGRMERPAADAPGMFALADPPVLKELIEEAGFVDVQVDAVEFEMRYPSVEDYWPTVADMGRAVAEATAAMDTEELADFDRAIAEQVAGFVAPGGELVLPARTLVAAADA
jgi:SAM-dependent methyltransferase